jgi:deoxyribodipyrimidine photo-lyase
VARSRQAAHPFRVPGFLTPVHSTIEISADRRRALNDRPIVPDASYVLYWMTAHRRLGWNHALEVAVEVSRALGRPLVVLEALRADYPWASRRHHRFVMDGMVEHATRLARGPVTYFPYVEPTSGAGRGLLRALATEACLVVADDWPGFFHPPMLAAAARIGTRVEAVDACGLVPLRAATRAYPTAYAFRRFLQGALPEHLARLPAPDPLPRAHDRRATVPEHVLDRWKPTPVEQLRAGVPGLDLPATPGPAPFGGGTTAARERLARFLGRALDGYAERRNVADGEWTSGLSPYLHFGHISPHEVLAVVADREGWTPGRLGRQATGKREGWWGMSRSAEAFLDQIVTWRELGFNAATHLPGYQGYGSLPDWAAATLADHADDPRSFSYSLEQFDAATTHDPVWNAAQRQLRRDGTIQNYLRMLWGKKILEWSPSPERAAEVMVELNNRYALDGRDPNSYAGIYWCLGRYDRPWGPERPIFGKIRYMSSANTARKLNLAGYMARFGVDDAGDDRVATST